MNRSALLALLAVGGLVVAVVVLLLGPKPADEERTPAITSSPGASPTPVETLQPEVEDPLPQDDTAEGVIDLSAEEGVAEAVAVAWMTFDSAESADARAARLTAAGGAASLGGSAPQAARADELDGLVDARSTVAVTKVLLVALDDYGDDVSTYAVFVELTADYAQPGSSQTFVDGAELLVTVEHGEPLRAVAISER